MVQGRHNLPGHVLLTQLQGHGAMKQWPGKQAVVFRCHGEGVDGDGMNPETHNEAMLPLHWSIDL